MGASEEYTAVAIDHAQNPRNHGPLARCNGHARVTGPCGETMEFWLEVAGGRIARASFETDGCGSSIACGSAITELVTGKSVEDALAIESEEVEAALGGLPEDVKHCALLAAQTLRSACENFLMRDAAGSAADREASETGKEGTCEGCGGGPGAAADGRPNETEREAGERRKLADRLGRIRHKVLVLSGKGGVGKSTVAVNLAISLALAGRRVGLLDIDIHGPTVPKMLGIEEAPVRMESDGIAPVESAGLKVMSIGFFLPDRDDAVIWRGPLKMTLIRQFLSDVTWGDLDCLVVDVPPGTGDEPLSICQMVGDHAGAIIVTTSQEVALSAVRKSISFCRKLGLPVIGVVENMSGFVCPHCGRESEIFTSGGGERMAREMGVPFLSRIPLDPMLVAACDSGEPYIRAYRESETARAFERIARPILDLTASGQDTAETKAPSEGGETMIRFAVPTADGRLSAHFGHCRAFALIDADPGTKTLLRTEVVAAPEHQPGLLPRWLAERGVGVVIAGGMGSRAQDLFRDSDIRVVVGAPAQPPETLVTAYLNGNLETGENVCDH